MIVTVNWTTFHLMYMNQNTIYVKENDDSFELWTSQNMFFVKCIVEKKEDQEENMIFIERYLTGKTNVIKVDSIEEFNFPTIPQPAESPEAIREEDVDVEEEELPEIEEEMPVEVKDDL